MISSHKPYHVLLNAPWKLIVLKFMRSVMRIISPSDIYHNYRNPSFRNKFYEKFTIFLDITARKVYFFWYYHLFWYYKFYVKFYCVCFIISRVHLRKLFEKQVFWLEANVLEEFKDGKWRSCFRYLSKSLEFFIPYQISRKVYHFVFYISGVW